MQLLPERRAANKRAAMEQKKHAVKRGGHQAHRRSLTTPSMRQMILYLAHTTVTLQVRKSSNHTLNESPFPSSQNLAGIHLVITRKLPTEPVRMCKMRRCQLSYMQLITTPCLFCLSVEDFEEKYDEQDMLGEGQYGEVFFGKRREDNFPVWLLMCALYACFLVVHPVLYVLFLKHIFSLMQVVIKHVPQKSLYRQPMV